MNRAIVFDLDETLYRERRFVLSGFAAVSRQAEASHGVSHQTAFRLLTTALRAGARDTALQALAAHCGAGDDEVLVWRGMIRRHRPQLCLPRRSREVLQQLRPTWRLGVLTNGLPMTQRNKVEALGLAPLIDAVVFAEEGGRPKPDASGFLAILERLAVRPDRALFVGDDPWTDIHGASQLGMRTIRIRRARAAYRSVPFPTEADVTVMSIADVPAAAERLWGGDAEEGKRHVA